MRVLVTGANGRIGTAIRDHLGDRDEYEFTWVDVEEHPEYRTTVADVTDPDAMADLTSDQDAIVHLAMADFLGASNNRSIDWHDGYPKPIKGLSHVLSGAKAAGAKVVYASSNHAVGLYEVHNAPEIYYPDFDLTVDHTVRPCPDSRYGAMKMFGEGMGQLAGEVHDVPFYAIRIGATREREWDHPYGDAERLAEREVFERGSDDYDRQVARMKCLWMSRRDLGQMVHRCLQDDSVDFDVFYGVSESDRTWFDIEHAREVLGYEPRDNASAWDGPPGD